MTTYTSTDFATRVLKDLGLVGADETPSNADLTFTIESNASEVALLSAKGIAVVNGSDETVPQEYLTALSRRCGDAIAVAFGLMTVAEAALAMKEHERDLRILCAKPPTGSIAEAVYY